MPIRIVVGRMVWPGCCTKVFRRVAEIFLSPNSQKTQFWGEKIKIFKIFEKNSIGNAFRKVHAKFHPARPISLVCRLYQSLADGVWKEEKEKDGNPLSGPILAIF